MTGLIYNTRTDRVEGSSFTVSFFNATNNGVVELVEGYDFSSSSSSISSSSSFSSSSVSSSLSSGSLSSSSISSLSSQSSTSSTMLLTSSSGPDYYFVVSDFGEGNGNYYYVSGTPIGEHQYSDGVADGYRLFVGVHHPRDMFIGLGLDPKYYSTDWMTTQFISVDTELPVTGNVTRHLI